MFSKVALFLLAAVSAVSAGGTGFAIRNDPSVIPCPPRRGVPNPPLTVALPADQFTFSDCYKTVRIGGYKGKNYDTVLLGLYPGGNGSQNISLNDAAFNILEPPPANVAGPGVVWNIN